MNNLLEVTDLCKSFSDFRLDNISFSLPCGYIMGFIGPNGSGKTTVIKLILNMLDRDGGEIKIDGLDMLVNEKQVKQEIGAIFDTYCLCEDWNIADTEKALSPFFKKWDSKKYRQLITDFTLPEKLPVKRYSRGMQMKLMLACALSHDAKLLILDEPTTGLDPTARDELLTILADYISDGTKSVLFSTHITSDLERIADYVTYIQYGKMVYTGGKDEFIDSFRRVTGGHQELAVTQKEKIIGYRRTSTNFDGMIKACDMLSFENIQMEPLHIEDIMIYGNMEGYSYE